MDIGEVPFICRPWETARARFFAEAAGMRVILAGGLFHSLLVARAAQKLNELRARVRSSPDPERFRVGAQKAAAGWAAGRLLTVVLESCLVADGRLSLAMACLALNRPGLSAWTPCSRA